MPLAVFMCWAMASLGSKRLRLTIANCSSAHGGGGEVHCVDLGLEGAVLGGVGDDLGSGEKCASEGNLGQRSGSVGEVLVECLVEEGLVDKIVQGGDAGVHLEAERHVAVILEVLSDMRVGQNDVDASSGKDLFGTDT
jgi:hypothetical protein